MRNNILKFGSLIAAISLNIAGCASNTAPTSPDDPYENMNRKVFAFNKAIDKVIIRPVAKGYDFVLPKPAKRGVTNFFSNLDEIPNVINDALQAKPANAISDTWRFILNSTIGIGGLFDVATPLGLQKHHQDFGLTLAQWGSKNTPYIVLPLFGPSTVRDTAALPFNLAFSVTSHIEAEKYRYILEGIDLVNTRANLLPTDKLVNESFDPYVFIRDAYLQRRAYLIEKNEHGNNGNGDVNSVNNNTNNSAKNNDNNTQNKP